MQLRHLGLAGLLFLFLNQNLIAQGGWDLNYIPINSLNSNHIGQEIRIDFKTSDLDTLTGTINIRSLLFYTDTTLLFVNYDPVPFQEVWRIYVDHGILREQILEGVPIRKKKNITIREMFLNSISDSVITVTACTYELNPNKYPGYDDGCVNWLNLTIDKKKIKGMLMKMPDD